MRDEDKNIQIELERTESERCNKKRNKETTRENRGKHRETERTMNKKENKKENERKREKQSGKEENNIYKYIYAYLLLQYEENGETSMTLPLSQNLILYSLYHFFFTLRKIREKKQKVR